jgi:EAL domain-containing protein (putative c-di-GMP-specific phosphodiesterase class I)
VVCLVGSADQARDIAESYRKHVEDHLFEAEGKTQQLTFSIGIALITENSPNAKDLLGRAQTAAEEVSDPGNGGNGVRLYQPKRDNLMADTDLAINLIESALESDSFKLLYQPIISLRGHGDEHYEAFIRMLNEKGEEVSPYEFMPPNGPSEMASKIDKWVVLQTIRQLSEHRSKGHSTRLFINLTAETLQDKTFPSWLNVALQAARLPGDSLIFQISESNAITYTKQARDFSKGVQSLHCKFSINQFGLALNPFNLLKHLNPEYIKLDATFTEDLQKEDRRQQAKEVIAQLQEIEKLTIVPYVESASILSVLWQVGVNYIQGYYLQAPSASMDYDFSEQ